MPTRTAQLRRHFSLITWGLYSRIGHLKKNNLMIERTDTLAWHAAPVEAAYERLETTEQGLTGEEATRRLDEYGPNLLAASGDGEALKILIRQIHNPLIYVLLASTALAMATGKTFDGLVILGVIVLNALIGFAQEFRASKAIKALSKMVPAQATVLRDGHMQMVSSSELVPGDVVLLQAGDKVPADLRLVSVRTLKLEEAALTGESVPVEKNADLSEEHAGIGDRRSMAYSGTLVAYGTGKGVVVATGGKTELGRISQMLEDAADLETPLTQQLAVVGKWIAVGIVIVSVLLLGVGLVRGYPLADAILAAVTLAVAAIPEGLPAIVTIALAIGVQRMARRRAIVRKLPAVETLGSTTVICSDKTGTLTRNEMTVQILRTPERRYRLTGVGYEPVGALLGEDGEVMESAVAAQPKELSDDLRALVLAGTLCNDAALREEHGRWQITGDPTEGALVVAAHKLGLEAQAARSAYRRVDAIPFESERQYMATLHEGPDGDHIIYVKGAPEVVLDRCGGRGATHSHTEISEEVRRIAAEGMRVLAFAERRVPGSPSRIDEEDVEGGLTFLGVQGMIDPPRPEAVEAVRACREAGISVKMITGDHPETARAIGEQLGLTQAGVAAISGSDVSKMTEQELRRAASSHNVFARVAPEHKLRLVQALQAEKHVAAMTGDGVNDAPALKQADIGVAMGITGTAVSKEAADMILTDDNFATIRAAVEEGRRVYDNLIKALAFVLPTNLGLAMILVAAVAFFPVIDGQPLLPMLPVQILWINLVAAVALALPLAFEAMEPNLMRRKPRRPDAPVLSGFVIGRTFVVATLMAAGAIGLFLLEYYTHADSDRAISLAGAQTEAVTTVILFQIFYLMNCRSLKDSVFTIGLFSNPWVYVGIGVVLLLQIGFSYLPFMNAVFGSAPLSLPSWIEAVAAAITILPVIGFEKWWRKRGGRSAD